MELDHNKLNKYLPNITFVTGNILSWLLALKALLIEKDVDHLCHICNKTFMSKSSLEDHMKTHEGNYKCFNTPFGLRENKQKENRQRENEWKMSFSFIWFRKENNGKRKGNTWVPRKFFLCIDEEKLGGASPLIIAFQNYPFSSTLYLQTDGSFQTKEGFWFSVKCCSFPITDKPC